MGNIKSILIPTFVLTLISVLVAGLLAFTYNATGVGDLGTGLTEQELTSFATVIPDAKKLAFVDHQTAEKDLLGVYVDENKTGVALHIQVAGYAGKSKPIEALVGFDKDGAIVGVEIVACQETPGLGTKVKDKEYLKNYVGIDDSAMEVDTITSATISSKALRSGVDFAIKQFQEVKGAIFS